MHRAAFERARSTWAELGELRHAPGKLLDDVTSSPQPSFVPPAGRRLTPAMMRRAMAAMVLVIVGMGLGLFWFGDPLLLLEADYRTLPGGESQRDLGRRQLGAAQCRQRPCRTLRRSGAPSRVAGRRGLFHRRPKDRERDPAFRRRRREWDGHGAWDRIPGGSGSRGRGRYGRRASGRGLGDHDARETRLDRALAGPVGPLWPYQRHRKREEVNLQRATAWRRGELVFDKARLSDVVAELNRYRRGRIVISDGSLADRRVSGFFRTDELDGALASMTRELGARALNLPPFLTVLY